MTSLREVFNRIRKVREGLQYMMDEPYPDLCKKDIAILKPTYDELMDIETTVLTMDREKNDNRLRELVEALSLVQPTNEDCDILQPGMDGVTGEIWVIQLPDGSVIDYDTEEQACKFQRIYRIVNDCDPMTGEKLNL